MFQRTSNNSIFQEISKTSNKINREIRIDSRINGRMWTILINILKTPLTNQDNSKINRDNNSSSTIHLIKKDYKTINREDSKINIKMKDHNNHRINREINPSNNNKIVNIIINNIIINIIIKIIIKIIVKINKIIEEVNKETSNQIIIGRTIMKKKMKMKYDNRVQ